MNLSILTLIGGLEDCYDLIGDIADKAREEACEKVDLVLWHCIITWKVKIYNVSLNFLKCHQFLL